MERVMRTMVTPSSVSVMPVPLTESVTWRSPPKKTRNSTQWAAFARRMLLQCW